MIYEISGKKMLAQKKKKKRMKPAYVKQIIFSLDWEVLQQPAYS